MQLTVPVETMVPISRFGRGTASSEFAKVGDGTPVTVMKNNHPAYFILNEHDYRHFRELENELVELKNEEARRQALTAKPPATSARLSTAHSISRTLSTAGRRFAPTANANWRKT